MKLLFDHNLSPKLINKLVDLFPDSNHVYLLNLDKTDDEIICDFAGKQNFVIVTKDSDFNDLCLAQGFPPKIIWIRRGNCSTEAIEHILRNHFEGIINFYTDRTLGVLMLY
jgi:predicted nuclease of predicted toxin-antitoxin system